MIGIMDEVSDLHFFEYSAIQNMEKSEPRNFGTFGTRTRTPACPAITPFHDVVDLFITYPGLPIGMLRGYKANHLSRLQAEVSRLT